MPAWIVVIWFKIPASSICDKCWHGYWWPDGKSLHVRFLVDVGVESGVSGGVQATICRNVWCMLAFAGPEDSRELLRAVIMGRARAGPRRVLWETP